MCVEYNLLIVFSLGKLLLSSVHLLQVETRTDKEWERRR